MAQRTGLKRPPRKLDATLELIGENEPCQLPFCCQTSVVCRHRACPIASFPFIPKILDYTINSQLFLIYF